MKRITLTMTIFAAALLTGCSSSGSSSTNESQKPTLPDIDDSPSWGLDMGDAPDWGIVDPDFGIPDTGEAPNRLPPVWGGPDLPPIDNGPVAGYTISGESITDSNGNVFTITNINWHGQSMIIEDKDGNEYRVDIIRQGEYEGDFGIVIDGESIIIGRDTVDGGLRPLMESTPSSIDHSAIRDSIRSLLN